MIHPPKYSFAYTLVRIDERYNVIDTIEKFPAENKIYSFSIDSTSDNHNLVFNLLFSPNPYLLNIISYSVSITSYVG